MSINNISAAKNNDIVAKLGDSDSTRFLILAIWSLSLLLTSGLIVTAAWLSTMGAALMFARLLGKNEPDNGELPSQPSPLELLIIGIWGLGPVLVYLSSHPEKFTISTVMIACGFLMVLGQYRNSIRPAIAVAVPYSLLSLWFLVQSFGTSQFLYTAIILTLLFGTFVSMTVFSVQTHKRLRAAVSYQQALIEELEDARLSAENSVGINAKFLSDLSHEIRTPLNGIIGMVEVAKRKSLAPEDRQAMDIIGDCSHDLSNILNDVLDLSKLEFGGLKLIENDFDIFDTLKNLQSHWTPTIEAKGLTFEVRTDPELPRLLNADIGRIKQCLNNVLGNALKYTNHGHISLSSTIKQSGDRGRLIFQITDTGVGISANDQKRIFSPFSKKTPSEYMGHTGLGLAMTKGLAEKLGGGVNLDSTKGRGSRFTLWFDVGIVAIEQTILAPQRQHALPTSDTSIFRGKRILVADDVDYNYGVIRSLIEPMGTKVFHAADGEQAIARLQTEHFDLVFMDVRMPVMDGVAATRIIRETPSAFQNVPIIAFTGHTLNEDIDRFRAAGMDAHFAKPVTFGALKTILERHLPREESGNPDAKIQTDLRRSA